MAPAGFRVALPDVHAFVYYGQFLKIYWWIFYPPDVGNSLAISAGQSDVCTTKKATRQKAKEEVT